MDNLVGRDIDRYHILEPLGEGGMARVYKAYDTRLERLVALKVIRREAFSPEALGQVLARFEREAKALARLSHPNIVKVHDYGEFEGAPYLVMEFIPGGTLKKKSDERMPWREAARLLLPVTRALAYAHAQGIIHRDIKPANILVTESGEPMLSDFGIAKILEAMGGGTLTGTGVGIGTPEYMAPEQGMGAEVDGRADEYALGVVFFELVTGRRPYEADTPMAVILKHITDPLPSPKLFAPELPDELELILDKALAKQPENRYPQMSDFAAALEKLIEGQAPTVSKEAEREAQKDTLVQKPVPPPPARAAPARPAAEARKPLTGKWLAIGAGGLVIFCLLAGGLLAVGRLWRNLRARITPTAALVTILDATATTVTEAGLLPSQTPEAGLATPLPGLLTETPPLLPPTPYVIEEATNPADGAVLVRIPAGSFNMGASREQSEYLLSICPGCDQETLFSAQPVHTVQLSEYWMDKTEVSNAMYARCVEAGACSPPSKSSSERIEDYYGNPDYANFPVIYVNWEAADTYCRWAGGRLPTEAEWEYAARGNTGWLYPWGDQLPDENLANVNNMIGDTTPVDWFPKGASPFGLLNMTGNVWEWVWDWYQKDYYSSQASWIDPQGPSQPGSPQLKSGRGGAYWISPGMSSAAMRDFYDPEKDGNAVGFRCAFSILPGASSGEPSGKIVYTCQVTKYETRNQICVINADGTGTFQLTTDANNSDHLYPTFAPDEKSVMFSSDRSGEYAIFEMTLDGRLSQITDGSHEAYGADISPDGQRVVFTQIVDELRGIYVMNRDGSDIQPVYAPGDHEAWDVVWSPDGKQVLFASDRTGTIQLFTSNLDGTNLRQVSNMEKLRGRSDWAADGVTMATYAGDEWLREIYLLDAATDSPRQITTGGNNLAPSFSADGGWIAFTSYRDHPKEDQGCEIYVMRSDGTDVRRLTDNDYCDWQPRWGS
jgi:eukaryotic-like serine/threonine-protein kinase